MGDGGYSLLAKVSIFIKDLSKGYGALWFKYLFLLLSRSGFKLFAKIISRSQQNNQ